MPVKFSIRNKLLLGYILVLSLSFIIYPLGLKVIENTIRYEVDVVQMEKAENAAVEVQNFIALIELDNLGISEALGNDLSAENPDAQLILSFTIDQNSFYDQITVTDTAGNIVFSVERNGETPADNQEPINKSNHFNEALAGKTSISDVYFPEEGYTPKINVYAPVVSSSGTVTGTIKSQLNLKSLWFVISQVKMGDSGFMYLVDNKGNLIAHPNAELVLRGENYKDRGIVAAALANKHNELPAEDHYYINNAGLEVIANSVRVDRLGWAVIAEQPTNEAFAQLINIKRIAYIALLISIGVLLTLSLILSKNMTKPIKKLQGAAEKLKQGKLDTRANLHSGDEIEDLGNTIDLMASQLKKSMVSLQKEKDNILTERNKLDLVISGISDAVIAVNLGEKIVTFNDSAEELLGYKAEEVLTKPVGEVLIVEEDGKKLDPTEYCLLDENPTNTTLKKENLSVTGANGKSVVANVVAGQLKTRDGIIIGSILTLHDVTKEKQLEEMKFDFVTMAAHELRTPLTAIQGYIQLLISEANNANSKDRLTYLSKASGATERLYNLVENLLGVSRIEKGTLQLSLEPVDWPSFVKETISDFDVQAKEKEVTIEMVEPIMEIPKITVSPQHISEVIYNLLSNAIKYNKKGGKVTFKIELKDNEIITHVEDTGEGIPEYAIPYLFTKFFRVPKGLEEGVEGVGLGLYMSSSLVKLHGGRIWVESEVGKGSTFSFAIPLNIAATNGTRQEMQETQQPRNQSQENQQPAN